MGNLEEITVIGLIAGTVKCYCSNEPRNDYYSRDHNFPLRIAITLSFGDISHVYIVIAPLFSHGSG
jgi:hypothetical protein